MKRNGSLAAGILAVLTFVGVSNLPSKSSESPPERSRKPASPLTRPSVAPVNQPYSACTEIAKRVRRLVANPQLPPSCYASRQPEEREKINALTGVRFAIAILPNPVSTHLPLLFDRLVQSILQAAQDDNYAYDASWFPWDTDSKTYELLVDQLRADELQEIQQNQPGVMVFRRAVTEDSPQPYDGGLIVLVVGEQPTGGISDDQFENALAWITKLGDRPGEELRILGPTFSGSLPSLKRFLDRQASGYPKLLVSSGTVSGGTSYRWFDDWIRKRPGESRFQTAMESDRVLLGRFCAYLRQQNYPLDRVAVLSEDQTAFGRVSEHSPCEHAINLYYPRDIATLRSAYQQQSIFGASKPEDKTGTPSTALRGDLSEPSTNDHDTVRSYGGQLTPLAQESILLDIANRLSENRIEFVILRSTSSLDQIFLSQFLRRSYPEGRIVIDGADLLFSRGAEGKSLRGVMLLSTYPLFTAEQDWTAWKPVVQKSYRTFGEDTSEGEYIAARGLFRDPPQKADVPVRDYSPPAWAIGAKDDPLEDHRPVTWLGVIGRRQFWPLAALNSDTLNDPTLRGTLAPFWENHGAAGNAGPLEPPTAMWMFLLACVAWSAIHWYFCSHGSIFGSPRARAYFAPVPRIQHPVLIALGSVLLAMMAVTVASGSGLFAAIEGWHPFHRPRTAIILGVMLLACTILAVSACVKNYALLPVTSFAAPLPKVRYWRRVAGRSAVLCFVLFALLYWFLLHNLTPANRIPLFWRNVNFTSGVSGLLPQILLFAGAYLWSWCNLRGLAHFGDDRPILPKMIDLPELLPMFSDEKVRPAVENAALPLTHLLRLLVVFVGVIVICWVALDGDSMRTLGEHAFGEVIFVWVCLYIAVILTDGFQTWEAWSELRQLLNFLDRLPLRRTLRALKGLAWGSIWKLSGNVLEERYRVISLQIESLRHLKNTVTVWVPDDSSGDDDRHELLQKINESQESHQAFANWFGDLPENAPVTDLGRLHDFQEHLTSIAGMAMKTVLIRAWGREKDSLIFGGSGPEANEPSKLDISTEGLEPHVRAAEEFFVLPYLAFIQNILGRLRTIALGMVWLFLGATLAVSSYPFDPLSVLGGIFLVVFLLLGGSLVLVYSQMSRNATLSHITNTPPGELGMDFWLRLVGFGVGPLIGLLTTLFPSITDFAFSWLEPSVQALK